MEKHLAYNFCYQTLTLNQNRNLLSKAAYVKIEYLVSISKWNFWVSHWRGELSYCFVGFGFFFFWTDLFFWKQCLCKGVWENKAIAQFTGPHPAQHTYFRPKTSASGPTSHRASHLNGKKEAFPERYLWRLLYTTIVGCWELSSGDSWHTLFAVEELQTSQTKYFAFR